MYGLKPVPFKSTHQRRNVYCGMGARLIRRMNYYGAKSMSTIAARIMSSE